MATINHENNDLMTLIRNSAEQWCGDENYEEAKTALHNYVEAVQKLNDELEQYGVRYPTETIGYDLTKKTEAARTAVNEGKDKLLHNVINAKEKLSGAPELSGDDYERKYFGKVIKTAVAQGLLEAHDVTDTRIRFQHAYVVPIEPEKDRYAVLKVKEMPDGSGDVYGVSAYAMDRSTLKDFAACQVTINDKKVNEYVDSEKERNKPKKQKEGLREKIAKLTDPKNVSNGQKKNEEKSDRGNKDDKETEL